MESLAPLRGLEPTAELRLRNRRRLSAALVEEERRRLSPRLPLWRRRLSISLPVAILALAVALLAGGALAWWLDLWGSATSLPVPVVPAPEPAPIVLSSGFSVAIPAWEEANV